MNNLKSQNIAFHQFKIPALDSGDYELTIRQTIQEDAFTATSKFSIQGPRFTLPTEDVQAVYPPRNSNGDHTNILPHIVLSRDTLPWERNARKNQKDGTYPWMAMLVLCGQEIPKIKEIKINDLNPLPFLESSQSEEDKINVIELDRTLLEKRLPLPQELSTLAHVREVNNPKESRAISIILANRLPLADRPTSVYLLSLEYCIDVENNYHWPFQLKDGLIRLVVLHHWSFSCFNEPFNFSRSVHSLNRSPFCLNRSTKNQTAVHLLEAGFIPLEHQLRKGRQTVSWYRGPLLPSLPLQQEQLVLPALAADQLLRFQMDIRMLDVSYAAAWQIGRLIALAHQPFAIKLSRWKQAYVRQNKKDPDYAHLPKFSNEENDLAELPPELENWFEALRQLKMVPFIYLVPEQSLLPPDSIRFFCIDPYWVDCLVDGAYSIGNIFTDESEEDKIANTIKAGTKSLSGILLRSKLICNWPGLLIEGFSKTSESLKLVRMDRLSDEVLICLFEGQAEEVIKFVNVSQQPEMLHFGFEKEADPTLTKYEKTFRTVTGDLASAKVHIPDNLFRNKDQHVLNISKLSKMIVEISDLGFKAAEFTSAEFALSMIEGVEKVCFTVNP